MSYTPKPGSQADRLLAVLKKAGRAMRTPELAEASGLTIIQASTALVHAVERGAVTMCKVSHPNGAQMNEYRLASGMPMISHGDYNPKKKTITTRRPADPPAPTLPALIAVSTAQPEVAANNTGSDVQMTTSSPAAVAVAASRQTPEPEAKLRELGPASPKVPAGNVDLGFSIDDGGSLTIYLNDGMSDPLVLEPAETLALGDFLWASEKLWRP